MKVKIWGARGSIPVSGRQYLKYGGDSTCVQLTTAKGEVVILDAGTGLRRLGNQMLKDKVSHFHLLLTHAHWDHLMGFPFFKPLYRKSTSIMVHGCSAAQRSLKKIFADLMHPPYFPVDFGQVAAELKFKGECQKDFSFGGLKVKSIPISHPNGGFGFRIEEGGKSLVFIPDNELSHLHPGGKALEDYADFCRGADVLMHDGEYLLSEYEAFSKGYGHSVFLDTVRLAVVAKVKKLYLWHLNQDHDDAKINMMLKEAKKMAKDMKSKVKVEMAAADIEFVL